MQWKEEGRGKIPIALREKAEASNDSEDGLGFGKELSYIGATPENPVF